MKQVDVEIYINQFINFFNNNPNDLIQLIGDVLRDDFYNKVREQAHLNVNNGDDVTLTQSQIIKIVLDLKSLKPNEEKKLNSIILQTNFGQFSLN